MTNTQIVTFTNAAGQTASMRLDNPELVATLVKQAKVDEGFVIDSITDADDETSTSSSTSSASAKGRGKAKDQEPAPTPNTSPVVATELAPGVAVKPATIDEVKTAVGDDAVRAQAALDAELATEKPRSTLVAHLEAVVAATNPPAPEA